MDDGPRSEIVQWFDDPVWTVQSVPTPIAFGFGLVLGAAAAVLWLSGKAFRAGALSTVKLDPRALWTALRSR